MYVKRVTLKNVKCFSDFTLEFPDPPTGERSGGWYVIVGPNGMGKSTILRAIALCIVGERTANRLLDLEVEQWTGRAGSRLQAELVTHITETPYWSVSTLQLAVHDGRFVTGEDADRAGIDGPQADQTAIVAGYGAFRRAGVAQTGRLGRTVRELASLFGDDEVLDGGRWLLEARARAESADSRNPQVYARIYQRVVQLVNASGILPTGFTMLLPTPDGVRFEDPLERPVDLTSLGDGYRSIVGMVLSLFRDLMQWQASPNGEGFGLLGGRYADVDEARAVGGVVLIDEPDAHLHPSWQREIGFALQRVFPNMQFIVATHSPFICQAASPGGIFQLRMNEAEKRIEAVQPVEGTVQGWHIEDIYDRALGADYLLDVPTQELRDEYDALEGARVRGELTGADEPRLRELGTQLDATLHAPGRSREERERYARLDALVRELEGQRRGGGSAG